MADDDKQNKLDPFVQDWYDALAQGKDEGEALIAAIRREEQVKAAWARIDYTDEFAPYVADVPGLTFTVTRESGQESPDITFEFRFSYQGGDYSMGTRLARYSISTLDDYTRMRQYVFREVAYAILNKFGVLEERRDRRIAEQLAESLNKDTFTYYGTIPGSMFMATVGSELDRARTYYHEYPQVFQPEAWRHFRAAVDIVWPPEHISGVMDGSKNRIERFYDILFRLTVIDRNS